MFDKLRWPDSLSLMWCVISPGWPQGAVLTKLTSILLVQMSWWELESHRQTCLSYPHVRNWGFKGWTARPHSSSVWPCRGEERRVFFFCLQHHRFTNVSLSRAASWGCAAFSLCYIFVKVRFLGCELLVKLNQWSAWTLVDYFHYFLTFYGSFIEVPRK